MVQEIATRAAIWGFILLLIGVPMTFWGLAELLGVPASAGIGETKGSSILVGTGAVLIVVAVLLILYAAQVPYTPNE